MIKHNTHIIGFKGLKLSICIILDNFVCQLHGYDFLPAVITATTATNATNANIANTAATIATAAATTTTDIIVKAFFVIPMWDKCLRQLYLGCKVKPGRG